jgi:hypothetical protein
MKNYITKTMIFLLSTRNIGNHYFLNKITAIYMLFFIIYKLFATPCARPIRMNQRETPSRQPCANPSARTSARPIRMNHPHKPARDPAREPAAKTIRINQRETHPREPSARTLRETHPREPSARTMRDNHARNHPRNPFAKPCARTIRENQPRDPFARPHKVYHTETTLTILVRLHSITIYGNKKNPLSSGYFRPPKMAKKKIHEIWPPKKNESTVQKTTSVPPY